MDSPLYILLILFVVVLFFGFLAIDQKQHTFNLIEFSVNISLFSVCIMWMMDIRQKLDMEIDAGNFPKNQINWIIKLINTHFSDPLREWEIVYQKELRRANDPSYSLVFRQ